MVEESYVSFETAKLLKEKGFNEELLSFYIVDGDSNQEISFMYYIDDKIDNTTSKIIVVVPTQQMAMQWLRRVHNIHINIEPDLRREPFKVFGYIFIIHSVLNPWYKHSYTYVFYEDAVEAAIKYCLENLI